MAKRHRGRQRSFLIPPSPSSTAGTLPVQPSPDSATSARKEAKDKVVGEMLKSLAELRERVEKEPLRACEDLSRMVSRFDSQIRDAETEPQGQTEPVSVGAPQAADLPGDVEMRDEKDDAKEDDDEDSDGPAG